MMSRTRFALLLVLGCSEQEQSDTTGATTPVETTHSAMPPQTAPTTEPTTSLTETETDTGQPPYTAPTTDTITPLLSTDDIEQGINEAIAVLLAIDPLTLHTAYSAQFDVMDGECLYFYDYYLEDYDQYYWADTCETAEGTSFNGYLVSYDWDGSQVSGPLTYDYRRYLSGVAKIEDPGGNTLEISGYSSFYEYNDDIYGARVVAHSALGDFRWSGPDVPDSWLDDNLSIVLSQYGQYWQTEGVYMSTSASLSGMTGTVNAIDIENAVLYSEGLGSPCAIEPANRVSVRDSDGEWYDIDFQGTHYWGGAVFAPHCDGCGQASYRGEFIGDVCPDFSPLLEWEDRPW